MENKQKQQQETVSVSERCKLESNGYFTWCNGMNMMLNDEANSMQKGLVQINLFNFKTGKDSCLGVIYRTSHKKDSKKLLLNLCPWCGEKIINQSKINKGEDND